MSVLSGVEKCNSILNRSRIKRIYQVGIKDKGRNVSRSRLRRRQLGSWYPQGFRVLNASHYTMEPRTFWTKALYQLYRLWNSKNFKANTVKILSLGLNYGGKITQSKQKVEYLIRLRQIGSNDFQKLHLSLATRTVSHNAYSLKCLQKFRNASAPCEIRTHDLQFTRRLLYPWANEASVWTPISLNVFWHLFISALLCRLFVCFVGVR